MEHFVVSQSLEHDIRVLRLDRVRNIALDSRVLRLKGVCWLHTNVECCDVKRLIKDTLESDQ